MKSDQPLKLLKEVYDRPAVLREIEFLHKRVNEVFTVGDIVMDRTITDSGTTGARTINKLSGTVNIAAAQTTIIVTNSFVNENSLVFCTVRTNDVTAVIKNVVPGDGFFTIRLSAAATAETSIGFMVFN